MKFVLEIELGNNAMQSLEDVSHAITNSIGADSEPLTEFDVNEWPRGIIRDENGNTVGKWEVGENV